MVSAYEQLLAEGYASGKVGSGSYVSSDLPEPVDGRGGKRAKRPSASAKPVATEAPMPADFPDVTAQSEERPFNLGRTLVDARTMELWRKVSARVFRSLGHDHFGYSDPRGLPELRKSICDYLRAARAVHCDPGQIVVTAGTQHAIDLVIRVLYRQPDLAGMGRRPRLFADPAGADRRGRQIAPGSGRRTGSGCRRGHPLRAQGTRRVRHALASILLTGVVLSMARRLELLNWARENKAWVIEDDYASEFRYGGRALASLQGLDESERVIYVGTLNKALFPGLRLGYAVVPPALLKQFVTARYLMDRQPSSLSQAAVADFIEEGHFAAHLRRMRAAVCGSA